MTTAPSFMQGFKPEVQVQPGNPEALKYGRMWAEVAAYREVSPGEQLAQVFLTQARPPKGSDVIDFGCGTGRGALMLALLGGLRVTMIDFVRNCLDPELEQMLTTQAHAIRFVKHDLEQPLPFATPYGFACDLMEHIPEVRVDRVLRNILMAAQHVFFSISTVEDTCGAAIGERLHMTVQNYGWWLSRLNRHDCVIHWSQDLGDHCLFYVSAWQPGEALVAAGRLNVEEEQVRKNVAHNTAPHYTCACGEAFIDPHATGARTMAPAECPKCGEEERVEGWRWAQVIPHDTNDVEVMILGGGPSMPAFEAQMKAQRAAGVKLVTLNGAYTWALDHGLTPSAQMIVDARPFNARFVKPVVDGCKYLLASQCDPSAFEGLPRDRTFLWHTSTEMIRDILAESYGTEHWRVKQATGSWLSDQRGLIRLFRTEEEARAVGAGGSDVVKLGRPDAEPWFGIPGGSTVLLRAIPLLRMLGFKRFHLYGCDSCLVEEPWWDEPGLAGDPARDQRYRHHAYAQPENDTGMVIPVTCGGRMFHCAPWMVSQAQELQDMIRFLGDEIELEIYGDGLLAHMLATGAELSDVDLADAAKR